jgi:hypothetical protein
MFRTVLALMLAAGTAYEAAPLSLTEARTAREQNFVELHAANPETKDVFQGEALGRRLWVNSFGSTVTGDGPHGRINLHVFGNSVTGWSGNGGVNLSVFGNTVSGRGPLGNVHLQVNGNSIWGRVGNGHVNVSVFGGWASGRVYNARFDLSGFTNLNAVGVACLIGAL